MKKVSAALVLLVLSGSHAFWGSDDSKYVKKFAMMKVYESCFGDEVVKEVREEMRSAAARCAAAASGAPPPASNPSSLEEAQNTAAPPTSPPHTETTRRPPTMSAESMVRLQALLQGLRTQTSNAHQAVAGGMTSNAFAAPSQFSRPGGYPYQQPSGPEMHHGALPFGGAGPYNGAGGPFPGGAPYNPAFGGMGSYYYPPPPPAYYPPYNPYSAYMQRSSRDIGMRGAGVRMRNVTCVMQELGYLDSQLEPNYAGIVQRIERLPLSAELRSDMVDAVDFCRQFSQCVPEPPQDKMQVSSEFTKPMMFFRCYKQKKLEACVLKDVREKYMMEAPAENFQEHNGLMEEEESETPSLRGPYRGRSGRTMGPSAAATAAQEDVDLEFLDSGLPL